MKRNDVDVQNGRFFIRLRSSVVSRQWQECARRQLFYCRDSGGVRVRERKIGLGSLARSTKVILPQQQNSDASLMFLKIKSLSPPSPSALSLSPSLSLP
eukprot:scaffold260468_cov35-Tisochrysis_lutea.AAC.1